MSPEERLRHALAPDVVEALLLLVEERVAAATAAQVDVSPWLSVAEAAAYLRVSERTIERLIRRRRLPSTTLGRRRLVHRDDLDAAAREDVAPTTPPRRRRATLDPRGEEA